MVAHAVGRIVGQEDTVIFLQLSDIGRESSRAAHIHDDVLHLQAALQSVNVAEVGVHYQDAGLALDADKGGAPVVVPTLIAGAVYEELDLVEAGVLHLNRYAQCRGSGCEGHLAALDGLVVNEHRDGCLGGDGGLEIGLHGERLGPAGFGGDTHVSDEHIASGARPQRDDIHRHLVGLGQEYLAGHRADILVAVREEHDFAG